MGRNGAARDGVQVDWRGRPTSVLPIIDLGSAPPGLSGGDAVPGVLTSGIGVVAAVLGVLLLQAGDPLAGVAMVVAGLAAVGQGVTVLTGRYGLSRLAVIVGGVAAVGFGVASPGAAGLFVVGLGAFAVGFATAEITD